MRHFVAPPILVSLLLMLLLAAPYQVALAQDPQPIQLECRRELFVDTFLIESLNGAALALHPSHDEGVAVPFDRPWEGAFCGYATVIDAGEAPGQPRFRAYYRGLPDISAKESTCLAVSFDGIHWEKPLLGICPWEGNPWNNILISDGSPVTHNFSPFLDRRPDVEPQARYKALGGNGDSGLLAYSSEDGVHWRKLQEPPVFSDSGWVFDSQNVAFWSESEKQYVLYYRKSPDKVRAVARATSANFVEWSEPVMMTYADTQSAVPAHHLYTNQTSPYFRAPHIYVATAARFMPGRQVISAEAAQAAGVHADYFGDTSDAVLMTTRGGSQYDRTFSGALIRPAIGWENWVSRTNYPALNLVQTGPHEMSLYVCRNYGQASAHLRRYSLRLDGLASLQSRGASGEMITRPVTFSGSALKINYATSAAGSVQVELRYVSGAPIPGFSLEECPEIIGNEIERTVTWKGSGDLSPLVGTPVRLRCVLRDADIFSFQFCKLDGEGL